MPEYTTDQAAALLGTDRRNVQNYAKRHSLPKFGRQYIITKTDIEGMRNELGKPGPKARSVATSGTAQSTTADLPHSNAE